MKIFKKYSKLIEIVLKFKFYFLILVILDLITNIFGLATPFFTKLKVDQLQSQSNTLFSINISSPKGIFLFLVVAEFLTLFFIAIISRIKNRLNEKIRYKMRVKTYKTIYERFLSFDYGILQNRRTNRLLWNILDFPYSILSLINLVLDYLGFLLIIFGLAPAILILDYRIFVILVLAGILVYITKSVSLKEIKKLDILQKPIRDKNSDIKYYINSRYHQLMISGGSKNLIDKSEEIEEKNWLMSKKIFQMESFFDILERLLFGTGTGLIFLILGFLVFDKKISLGTYVMIISYATQIYSVIYSVSDFKNRSIDIRLNISQINFLLNLKSKLKLDNIKPNIDRIFGDVVLENVSFRYPRFSQIEKEFLEESIKVVEKKAKTDQSDWRFYVYKELKGLLSDFDSENPIVLKNISLRLENGKITSLVGRNGSGKTTITNLILRGYDPDFGTVKIGNVNLINVHPETVRKNVSILQQEPFYMEAFSIRENLTLGTNREVRDDEIWSVLEEVGIKDLVENCPKKLDSIAGEDLEFSGGQKQLLSIARVLIQNRPVIIFDEGTNQLDPEKEAEVLKILQRKKEGRVILFITHRITTAKKADYIYVIDDGQIVESGTHLELLENKNGVYKHFWELQVVN